MLPRSEASFRFSRGRENAALPVGHAARRSPPRPTPPGRPAAELAAAEPRAGRNKGPIQPRGWERVLIKALAADVGAEVLFLMEKQAFAVMC